jgi:hypothetical protein
MFELGLLRKRLPLMQWLKERAKLALLHVPTWAALRTLGQSKLLGLTMLVPFLGTLILFNRHLVDWLLISPHWVIGTHASSPEDVEVARLFTITRLYVTYFGLTFLGTASFLFSIFCPVEVRIAVSLREYVAAETPLLTRPTDGLLVQRVSDDYLTNWGGELGTPSVVREMAYPFDQIVQFEAVINGMHDKIDGDGWPSDLYAMNGNLMVDRCAEYLRGELRVARAIWLPFHEVAKDFRTDLLTLKFLALNRSRPMLRMLVAGFYGLGFGILFWPTLRTFMAILWTVAF